MKIKDNYKVRDIAGEHLLVCQGRGESDLTKIISLNSTANYLWKTLKDRDFTLDDVANELVDKFGIDKATALSDSSRWIEKMKETGVIE